VPASSKKVLSKRSSLTLSFLPRSPNLSSTRVVRVDPQTPPLVSPSSSSHYSPYFSSPEESPGSNCPQISPLSFYHLQDRDIRSPKGPFDFTCIGTPSTPHDHDGEVSVCIENDMESNGVDDDLFSSPRSTANSSVARGPTKPLMKGFISSPSFLEEEVSSTFIPSSDTQTDDYL